MKLGQRAHSSILRHTSTKTHWLAIGSIAFLLSTLNGIAQQTRPCPLSSVNRTVTICRPLASVGYDSPVRVLAGASHTQLVYQLLVYLDGKRVYQRDGDVADTNLIVNPGTHRLTVRAVDAVGTFQTSISLVVRARPYPRFAYVANSNDPTLSVFTIEPNNGFVRQNSYVLAGKDPSGVAESWRGFVYVAGGTNGKLYAYRKVYGGRLSTVAGSPFACGTNCRAVAVDPSGKFVFAIDSASNIVRGYKINTTTGTLSTVPGSPFATGHSPSSIVISTRGALFVTNESTNDVSAYLIDEASGSLTPAPGSRFPSGSLPRAAAVDPFGNRLYVANYFGDSISAYKIAASGALTYVGSQVMSYSRPSSITVYPSGAFLYTANTTTNNISLYGLDIYGRPKLVGTYATGPKPTAIAIDLQGKYAVVAHSGAPYELWVYKIDLTTGALKFVRSTRTRGAGVSMAVSGGSAPVSIEPGYLYAGTANTSTRTGRVFAFVIGSTGGLSAIAGSPFAHPTGATALAAHPSGAMLYAPGLQPGDFRGIVAQYWVNRTTGALTAASSYQHPEEFESRNMVVDASGRFAYATSFGNREPWFTGWAVPPDGGPLGSWLFYPGALPWDFITLDPMGKYAYRAEQTILDTLKIDPATGAFSSQSSADLADQTVVDPTGRFAYGLRGQQVVAFSVSGSTGKLTQVGTAVATGTGPASVTIDPYGKFVYVANRNSNDVSAFKVNLGNGTLTAIGKFAAGTGPVQVVADATGRFLFAVNEVSLNISAYSINQSTGTLSVVPGSPFHLSASGQATSLANIGRVR